MQVEDSWPYSRLFPQKLIIFFGNRLPLGQVSGSRSGAKTLKFIFLLIFSCLCASGGKVTRGNCQVMRIEVLDLSVAGQGPVTLALAYSPSLMHASRVGENA